MREDLLTERGAASNGRDRWNQPPIPWLGLDPADASGQLAQSAA